MPALTIANVQHELTALTPEFAKTMPPGMTADRFARVALTAVQNNLALLGCEPQSLFNACMKAAQDGLLPDGREGAIIKRGNAATWQPMVQGIIAKAKRRGSVANLVANIVYEGEPFEVLMGDEDRIVHHRNIAMVKRGQEVAVYAIATLKDGTKEREVMTWDQVQDVRKMSSTPNAGPWVSSEGEMARKTVVRRLSKRLPALDDGDDELKQAIERVDELYPFGKKPAPVEAQATVVSATPPPARRAMPEEASYAPDAPYAARLDDLADRLAGEGDGMKWLAVLDGGLRAAETEDEVAAIMGIPNVVTAMAKAPAKIKGDMQSMSAAAFKRFAAPAEAPAPALDAAEAGVAK